MEIFKKKYCELEVEILSLTTVDVLTASDENDVVDDPYSEKWWH